MPNNLPREIRATDEPHPSYGGWHNFLERCTVRDEADGVRFFVGPGAPNCNYILFPCGELVQNFGFQGGVLMKRVREEGATAALEAIMKVRRELRSLLRQPS